MAKSKAKIPANVDPIKLADEMKKGMTSNWVKRRKAMKREFKPLLVH